MVIYMALGVGQAFGAFLNGITLALIVYSASTRLHDVRLLSSLLLLSNSWVERHHQRLLLHFLHRANTSLGHQVISPPFRRSSVACPQHGTIPHTIHSVHSLDLSEPYSSCENVFLLTSTWVQHSHSLCPYPVPFTVHPSCH